MADKKGREAELLELQKAEESHRDMLLKDRDERNKIAKDLHGLRRCNVILYSTQDAQQLFGVSMCMCRGSARIDIWLGRSNNMGSLVVFI